MGAVYHALNGTQAMAVLNTSSAAAILVRSDPIRASNINITNTEQGTRVLYNTVTMVLPIMLQVFFLMALNGISNQFYMCARLSTIHIISMRFAIGTVYTFLGSLTIVGYIWAFHESCSVNGNQFVLAWMTFWLHCHINFLILDAATAFIPQSFLSLFVLT